MTRRKFAKTALVAGLGLGLAASAHGMEKPQEDGFAAFFDLLKKRHSVRVYADAAVSDADVKKLLQCAMQAPSAANEQPWDFVVIRERELLEQIGAINQYAAFARHAPLAILVCLNEQKEKIKGMGIIDMGICSQNLLLAAAALGLGAVFTGIYPFKDRMDAFRKLCALPEYIAPVGLIVVGHPKLAGHAAEDRFNPGAVHLNKW